MTLIHETQRLALVGDYGVYDVPDVATAVDKSRSFLQLHVDTSPGWEGWVEVRPLSEAPEA